MSTLDSRANYVAAQAAMKIDYQKNQESLAYRVSTRVRTKKFYKENPSQLHSEISFDIGNDTFFCGMTFTKRLNDSGPSYLKYDDDNEIQTDVHCKKNF